MSIFQKKLTVNEAINAAHTSQNAMLIDCRSKEDFSHGHVATAVNIPLDKMTLYIIGSYNYKPEKAVRILKKMGYKHTFFGGNMEEHYGLLKK